VTISRLSNFKSFTEGSPGKQAIRYHRDLEIAVLHSPTKVFVLQWTALQLPSLTD
jgi:hypothetical protein